MQPINEHQMLLNRRHFFGRAATGIGAAALGSLMAPDAFAGDFVPGQMPLHFPPKVKRVIYLFQSGAPSQHDLFDYKPNLDKFFGKELPAEYVRDALSL